MEEFKFTGTATVSINGTVWVESEEDVADAVREALEMAVPFGAEIESGESETFDLVDGSTATVSVGVCAGAKLRAII